MDAQGDKNFDVQAHTSLCKDRTILPVINEGFWENINWTVLGLQFGFSISVSL